MKAKINLNCISHKCYLHRGFDSRGCFGSDCNDSCCKCLIDGNFGADFDKESYDLVLENRALIEPLVGQKIEFCFDDKFSGDKNFRGNDSIRSLKGKSDYCIFHNFIGKGCVLYDLANKNKVPKEIIPSICRLFPLTWDGDNLVFYDEFENGFIPKDCNCIDGTNTTSLTVLETQKPAIDDIFQISESLKKPDNE